MGGNKIIRGRASHPMEISLVELKIFIFYDTGVIEAIANLASPLLIMVKCSNSLSCFASRSSFLARNSRVEQEGLHIPSGQRVWQGAD